MSKVNLKELSKELNVSISTVSKALRGSYEIGTDTKKRVIEMAQQMGYNPNPYAGFLRNRKSKTIALITPKLTNNFFVQAISGAESIAREKNYHLLIYTTHDDFESEVSILNELKNGRVEGVIISLASTTTTYDHLNELILSGIPLIFFDRICHEIETAKIITDDFASGLKATDHLIHNGCRDIAFLSLSETLSIDNKRKQGYFEALNKHDIKINNARVIKCSENDESNYRKIKHLLQSKKRPDAVFASVEQLALITYQVCNELKIKIPQQLKIICFSNLPTASLLNPTLSTITQPAFEMGKEAATILFKYLAKKKMLIPNENIVIKSELNIRNSTKNKG